METNGYDGLADQRRGRASLKRVALATMEKVLRLRLFKEEYFDLNSLGIIQ